MPHCRDGIIQVAVIWVVPDTLLGNHAKELNFLSCQTRQASSSHAQSSVPSGNVWDGFHQCFTKERLLSSFLSDHKALIDVTSAAEMVALLPGCPISAEDWSTLTMVTYYLAFSCPVPEIHQIGSFRKTHGVSNKHLPLCPNDGTLNGFCPRLWLSASIQCYIIGLRRIACP